MSDATAPVLSVVIPAYRAAGTIGDCLASLCVQWEPPPFEVVVVDSSPDDATERIARPFTREVGGRLDLRVIRRETQTHPGTARNLGVDSARASRLLFLDADCVAFPDLLARAVVALDAGAAAVGSAIFLPEHVAASARIRHLLEFKESLPGVPERATWQIPSACVAFDRAVFERYGGFPDARASEDWLLNWTLWQAGETMIFDPRMRIRHRTPAGWVALLRYARLLGFASGRARLRGGLPGQWVVERPWLAAALPFGRTARALWWCARYAPSQFLFLLLAWPAYFAVAVVWARAFAEGVQPSPKEASSYEAT
ncbi:MAG: glycosyltransferase family 2 protein [Candidatus Binatia bacterium]|nr:glycosyltransferase family 2 protein [Candidatus Binatia bacterium]